MYPQCNDWLKNLKSSNNKSGIIFSLGYTGILNTAYPDKITLSSPYFPFMSLKPLYILSRYYKPDYIKYEVGATGWIMIPL